MFSCPCKTNTVPFWTRCQVWKHCRAGTGPNYAGRRMVGMCVVNRGLSLEKIIARSMRGVKDSNDTLSVVGGNRRKWTMPGRFAT